MLTGPRTFLLACTSLALLSGCGSSSYSSNQGTVTAAGGPVSTGGGASAGPGYAGSAAPAGTDDLVVATPSSPVLATAVGANRTLSITFTSSDGRPMTGFDSSEALGLLPAGWSGPARFGCTTVTTGSGCVLNLTYEPAAAGSGTLTINYVVVDNAGLPRTDGSLNVDYVASMHDNVVATASPTGEISLRAHDCRFRNLESPVQLPQRLGTPQVGHGVDRVRRESVIEEALRNSRGARCYG